MSWLCDVKCVNLKVFTTLEAYLAGLARISSPKETDNDLNPIHYWNTHVVLQQRTHQLEEEAQTFILLMKTMMTDRQFTIIKRKFSEHN